MTKERTPEQDYTEAAAVARKHAADLAPNDPGRSFGNLLADLFERLNEEALKYGALPPVIRRLGLEAARAYLGIHRDDEQRSQTFAALFESGDPIPRALAIMTVNEGNSDQGTSAYLLSSGFVDVFTAVIDSEVEVDAELHEALRKLAAGVIAISADDDPEVALDLEHLPIGMFADGTTASARMGPAGRLLAELGDQGVALLVDGNTAVGMRIRGDDFRQGRDFAEQLGVERPERFALRSGPLDPSVVDVYDEHGERIARITEQRDGSEWRVAAISPDGYAETLDTVSFERAVERLDTFLAERPH